MISRAPISTYVDTNTNTDTYIRQTRVWGGLTRKQSEEKSAIDRSWWAAHLFLHDNPFPANSLPEFDRVECCQENARYCSIHHTCVRALKSCMCVRVYPMNAETAQTCRKKWATPEPWRWSYTPKKCAAASCTVELLVPAMQSKWKSTDSSQFCTPVQRGWAGMTCRTQTWVCALQTIFCIGIFMKDASEPKQLR